MLVTAYAFILACWYQQQISTDPQETVSSELSCWSQPDRPEKHGDIRYGLLRSVGGWFALKEFRDSGIRIKGDERILGSSDFVESVLKQAEEDLDQRYRLEAYGIDIDTLLGDN